LCYALGAEFMATIWIGIVIILLILGLYVFLAVRIGKEHPGNLSFQQAFVKIVLMCMLAGLLSCVFNILLFNVIDTGFPQKMQEAVILKTTAFMERFNAPEEKIDETIEKLRNTENRYSTLALIKGYFFSLLMYAAFAAIVALILKRNKPLFDEPKSATESEPRSEPKSEPRSEPKSEPRSEPKSEPKSETKSETGHVS
jgi:hypothetical protein